MANNNRWGDFKGALANILASGKVYNTFTNSYAPRNVTGTRLISGVASQMGPAGTIAGMVATGLNNRGQEAQQFDAGMRGWQGIDRQLSERPDMPNYGLQVNDIGEAPQYMGGQFQGADQQSMAGQLPPMTTLPPVQAEQPWQGLGGNNLFAGGQGNFGGGQLGAMVRQPGALSFGGGRAGYNNGAGAGTGFGAYNIQNDSWGEAARGMGVGGMAGGARDTPLGRPKNWID